ncbi:hypothetical protein ABI59_00470 [Acidobacteria bacterium Mor1]|nr:hypothetical protein ABI59_00470 [Acidobacteria bacterium Mor1]
MRSAMHTARVGRHGNMRWAAALLLALGCLSTAAAGDIEVLGRVTGPEGAPIADASISLRERADGVARATRELLGMALESAAEARSAADGSFRIVCPEAGLWVLHIEAPGHVPTELSLEPLLESRVVPDAELQVDAGAKVRVVDRDGNAIPGARVRVVNPRGGRSVDRLAWRGTARFAVADEQGVATLPRAEGENAVLAAWAPGHRFAERPLRGNATTVQLSAAPARELVVTGVDGEGVSGAIARLGREGHPVSVSGNGGRLSVPPGDGEITLRVAADDGRDIETSLAPEAAVENDGEEPAPRVLELPERIALEGRLMDAESRRGIEGGLVWSLREPWLAVRTGPGGAYNLSAPTKRTIYINAGATGYLPPERQREFSVAEGRRGPAIPLSPAAAIEGTVFGDDGGPLRGAEISMKEIRGGGGMMEIRFGGGAPPVTAVTDTRGRFRLSPVDPENNYDVIAKFEGYAPSSSKAAGLAPYETRSGLRIEMQRGKSLRGTIVDADGAPVADASITASAARKSMGNVMIMGGGGGGEGATAYSGDDGSFAMTELSAGTYDLEIKRRGFARRKLPGIEIPEGDEGADAGEIRLEPGEMLQGQVLDDQGNPVEGARVSVQRGGSPTMSFGGPGAAAQKPDAETGADGWFLVDDLSADSTVGISVSRRGFLTEKVGGLAIPRVDPLEVELVAASDVSGWVIDDEGEPIAGAKVTLKQSRSMQMGDRVMMFMTQNQSDTDSDGKFLFEDVEPGKISLSAVAPGWQEQKREDIEVVRGEDLEDVEIPLIPGAVLEGRITTPDGQPAIGADVSVVAEDATPFRMPGSPVDGDGYYRLEGLVPGTVSVEANHAEYARTVKDTEVKEGLNELDLAFEGGQEVQGRLVGSDGKPVPGAQVRLAAPERYWGGFSATTAGDGTFTIGGVKDGTYRLSASAESYATYRGTDDIVVSGQPVTGLEIVLDRGAILTGKILGVEESKLGDVEIEAVSRSGGGFAGGAVDYQGNYRLENLAAGTWEVRAQIARSGRSARGEVTIEQGVQETTLDLQFEGGVTLEGRVTQADQPVKEATVWLTGTDVDHQGWSETDHSGRYVVEGLKPGNYRLNLRQWQTGLSYSESVEVQGDREVDIEIPTAVIQGRILDGADRSPLSGASVTVESSASNVVSMFPDYGATSDLDGNFTVANVTDGTWTLRVQKKGYATETREVSVQSERDVENITISLNPTEGLTLEVRLPGGQTPDEVRLAILDGTGQSIMHGRYPTGEAGKVRLSTVPAGSWRLVASASGSAATNVSVTAPGAAVPVQLAQATSLRVRVPGLAEGGQLGTVTLTDASGNPFRTLGWLGEPRSRWNVTGGEAMIGELPAGSWTVTVEAGEGQRWQGNVTTAPGAPAELVLD